MSLLVYALMTLETI